MSINISQTQCLFIPYLLYHILYLCAGNLAFEIDEDTLRKTFNKCGDINSVRIATDRETGQPRGFGHIEFAEVSAATKAVEMAGTMVSGRAIRVDFAGARPAGGAGGDRGFGGGRGGGFGGRGGGFGGGRGGGFGGRGGGRGGFGGGRGGGRGGFGGDRAPNRNSGMGIAASSGSKMTLD